MKTLRITTHWTTEEADCIVQMLEEFKIVVWEHYGDDIVEMHREIHQEQQKGKSGEFNDEHPF